MTEALTVMTVVTLLACYVLPVSALALLAHSDPALAIRYARHIAVIATLFEPVVYLSVIIMWQDQAYSWAINVTVVFVALSNSAVLLVALLMLRGRQDDLLAVQKA